MQMKVRSEEDTYPNKPEDQALKELQWHHVVPEHDHEQKVQGHEPKKDHEKRKGVKRKSTSKPALPNQSAKAKIVSWRERGVFKTSGSYRESHSASDTARILGRAAGAAVGCAVETGTA
jgi:hypothetical protein